MRPAIRSAARWVEHGLAIVGAFCLIYVALFDLSTITSESMSPTLQGTSFFSGDRVLTEKLSYSLRPPRRWEVVTFLNSSGTRIMKRVVGLPGESVRLSRRQPLEIDGKPVPIPPHLQQLRYIPYGNLAEGKPVPCGDGYYVLGDYTKDSNDSRFEGAVFPHQILGRAWLIVRPTSRLGFVQ